MSLRRVTRGAMRCGLLLATFSCGDRQQQGRIEPGVDTAAISQAAASAPEDWVGELGQLLVVPSDSGNAAVVIFPDFPSARLVASAPLTLLSASGDTSVARGRLIATESEQCGGAPLVHLSDTITAPWSIGLLRHSAVTMRMDSIETFPSADSIRLAGDLARIASARTAGLESRFTGLPFTVLSAHRIEEENRQTVVAHLVRRLPQEASPLEEHMLIVVERPRASPNATWVSGYTQRSEGTEDTAEHFTILATARAGDRTLVLLARDKLDQTKYEILERESKGSWRSRWSRTLIC
jgi:hypothetical protein